MIADGGKANEDVGYSVWSGGEPNQGVVKCMMRHVASVYKRKYVFPCL